MNYTFFYQRNRLGNDMSTLKLELEQINILIKAVNFKIDKL